MMSHSAADSQCSRALPMREVLAGLAFVTAVDLLTVLGRWPEGLPGWAIHTGVLVVLPWLTLLLAGRPAAVFGYQRGLLLLDLGWGVVAGCGWRLINLLLGLAWIYANGVGIMAGLISALLWVPFVEETFFSRLSGPGVGGQMGVLEGKSGPGAGLHAATLPLESGLAGALVHLRLWAAGRLAHGPAPDDLAGMGGARFGQPDGAAARGRLVGHAGSSGVWLPL